MSSMMRAIFGALPGCAFNSGVLRVGGKAAIDSGKTSSGAGVGVNSGTVATETLTFRTITGRSATEINRGARAIFGCASSVTIFLGEEDADVFKDVFGAKVFCGAFRVSVTIACGDRAARSTVPPGGAERRSANPLIDPITTANRSVDLRRFPGN